LKDKGTWEFYSYMDVLHLASGWWIELWFTLNFGKSKLGDCELMCDLVMKLRWHMNQTSPWCLKTLMLPLPKWAKSGLRWLMLLFVKVTFIFGRAKYDFKTLEICMYLWIFPLKFAFHLKVLLRDIWNILHWKWYDVMGSSWKSVNDRQIM
jgi:hypothetical protein